MASKLFTTFFFLQFFFYDLSTLSVASLTSISSACEVLSDSGYFSMGLTLQLATKDLSLEYWQELTIFAPSDQAFSRFGQPSLLHIKHQLSPTRLPGESLRILPRGVRIPTLRSNSSLIVTNSSRSGGKLSINNVAVHDSPVYDDGHVVIYGSDEFFTSDSLIPNLISSPDSIPIPSSATRNTQIPKTRSNYFNIFESASSFLMSRGFVIMATFLALQLQTSENEETKITVFAPIEEAIPNSTFRFSDYATIFKGHVIERLLSWKDLENLALEASILKTAKKGYNVELSWSGDILLVNGVPLIYPDLYLDEWVAVHGLNQMIVPLAIEVQVGDSFSALNHGKEVDIGEYSSYGLH